MLRWFLLVACLSVTVRSQEWTATGSLSTARDYHTATLLGNGNVLVVGGLTTINSAEIYNPSTGTWTQTGSLFTGRSYHTATLLGNGNVLVAGGFTGSGDLISAEIYNPSSGTWTTTGSLSTARDHHTATLFPNGNVLVAGGYTGSAAINSAEIYNPSTSTWTPTGSLSAARFWHTATLLANGNVLVAGGENGGSLNNAEICNPSSGTWTPTGSLSTARYYHTATLLANGNILVAGGYGSGGSSLNSAEVYNPLTGAWTNTGSLSSARYWHTATLLGNGNVLVAGGYTGSADLNSAEIYNPSSGTWTTTGSLSTARYGHTVTLLANGNVVVAGGQGSANIVNSAELFISTITTLSGCCSILQGIYTEAAPSTSLIVQCVNCPTLTTLGNFSSPVLYNAMFVTVVQLSCTNCPALTTFGLFSTTMSLPTVQLSCTMCPALAQFGSFPALTTATSLTLACSNCPIVSGTSMPSLEAGSTNFNVGFTCNNCPAPFSADAPISYLFSGSVPNHLTAITSAASLSFVDATLSAALMSSMATVRYGGLSFINVNGVSNLDALAGLERVDGSIIIQSTSFTNVDGITASLVYAGVVNINNNPVLCNLNTQKFDAVSASAPIILQNAFNATCNALSPVSPSSPIFVSRSTSSIQLTWTLPAQPSVLTVYTLTINGVATLTFPSWNPPALPYTISSLSPGNAYTFVLSATLDGITVSSPTLTVTTAASTSSNCASGQYKSGSGVCTPCGVSQFPSTSLTNCISCPPGSFSNASALPFSGSCQLCAAGTYAATSASTQCSACPANKYCSFGASAALQSQLVSASATTTAGATTAVIGFALGYIYLIVFFAVNLLLTALVVILPKHSRRLVSRFAKFLRTPRWLLYVNAEEHRLIEIPSAFRGLVAMWALVGVILVTIYQINNFAVNQFGTITTLQPGTTFTNDVSTLSASTLLTANISLIAPSFSCSSIAVSASLGGMPLATPICVDTSSAVNLVFGMASSGPLPVASTAFQINIAPSDGNLAFAAAMQYTFSGQQYTSANHIVTETIVGGSNNVVTGQTAVNFAAVATESLNIDGATTGTGYDFSYVNTLPGVASSPTTALSVSFQLTVPQYYLQVRQVQNISVVVFLSGIFALGAAALTAGTLLAFAVSYFIHNVLKRGVGRNLNEVELTEKKSVPDWF